MYCLYVFLSGGNILKTRHSCPDVVSPDSPRWCTLMIPPRVSQGTNFLRLIVFRCLCRGNFAPGAGSRQFVARASPPPPPVHHDCLLVGFASSLDDCCVVDALQWVPDEIMLQHTFSLEANPCSEDYWWLFQLKNTKYVSYVCSFKHLNYWF